MAVRVISMPRPRPVYGDDLCDQSSRARMPYKAPMEPLRLRAYAAFRARADAKSVSSLGSRAFPGLRYHGKGANRTPPTRCPAFSGLPQPGPPRRPKDFAPGSSRGRKNKPAGGEDLRRDDRVFGG